MSEKIYAWLLRLYPSRFRTAYGEEALQLFRDRSPDNLDLYGNSTSNTSRGSGRTRKSACASANSTVPSRPRM